MTDKTKGGFTLLETMIVIAIIGLLAAIVIPNLVKIKRAKSLRATMQKVLLVPSKECPNLFTKGNTSFLAVEVDKVAQYQMEASFFVLEAVERVQRHYPSLNTARIQIVYHVGAAPYNVGVYFFHDEPLSLSTNYSPLAVSD
ncbi:MAG: hypothetical protein A3G52_00950 [Candidatus Taylorbacteria bacterium RIFCSPLOWO2_12_FULL_43_20]|uniref:Type II secretion system protein GspG C-terminal domain-containing protein n=1 Tax=Candidatus Taylorbacteria bacterium RIFCSPLOWO2_12_FULL_43_20 TaxID=1802332 RepID=A0A1G2P1L0_9BACT|nr:MAG: hypothetical protein A2825_01875 [Candidatus Taylorbacteria bacterium RIFCSPHIGHO2_01_FULL_43_120]OHA23725.1 MAG: hypothetical protein A3B98_00800 [Candidatus Taylorbacteria bacterium RIFCSPHIGHO2_02_FULL_43_55]OHA27978.1 MAG: hypothetical protein A3E92_03115 [Candidatus Taylorbacteria bacterium RIFCSPHIGHO2_12_FULL_42_34]OHA31874.1 MAG: hypothetical protein A3B09_03000 [Candidatus Taylorbacteria bacterium RIFCSPLOWO2_01_FULL_43_83]OHA39823.1 MAG: hypothetical protein A3H58_03770 [Candi